MQSNWKPMKHDQLTKYSKSVVDGHDHDLTVSGHDTSVVCISGSEIVGLAVNEHDDRK